MPTIIKDNAIMESIYAVIDAEAAADQPGAILPLAVFVENRDALKGRSDLGLLIAADEEVESIADDLAQFTVIALNFPAFTDGRALSSANLLRRRYNYTGELRATGDVRRDQLEQMSRCGFNAFEIGQDQDIDKCLLGLKGFTYNYQGAIDRPEPLFRRR
jgi:uncharacterized protein (DUF934 family)